MSETITSQQELRSLDRGLRITAGVGLALIVPTVIGSAVVALTSPRAGRCLTYGEQCSQVSGGQIAAALVAAVVFGILAAAWPSGRLPFTAARVCAVCLQAVAQLTLAGLILGYG
ncbi:hypothetical protein [Wenjunlia tyrosinilytica]|uniref:Uncharacterized protein n=1 Tax=Wenjunlia tyrosinilytica TaxID=1544741 RepID=A0A917ZVU0_9ACTN|nr:hypothetical protein [Wenjunlia tyrosinilytica]GGO92905.1 hypothetical protein GCM10012280_44150 [Wenjunlia tyrosinilytica]